MYWDNAGIMVSERERLAMSKVVRYKNTGQFVCYLQAGGNTRVHEEVLTLRKRKKSVSGLARKEVRVFLKSALRKNSVFSFEDQYGLLWLRTD